MIDVFAENLIAFPDVPKTLPPNNGKRLHLSTLYRWAERGRHGVKLETICVGGRRFTSQEALQRFFNEVSGIKCPNTSTPTKSRQQSITRAERHLDAEGI